MAGEHVGFLMIRETDGSVVGWTGAGPKPAFPLQTKRPGSRKTPSGDDIWCISCLAMRFNCRGSGYPRQALSLLIEEARSDGAKAIEAYPIDPAHEAGAYRGSRELYADAGCVVVDEESADSGRTLVMRKDLTS